MESLEYLELVHADLCGPMKTESLNGSRYFLMFTDDLTRMSWVYFLSLKSDALEMFKKFKAYVEKQSGCVIKKLRTDNGGEFCSNDFDAFCEEFGIYKQLTAPYTPEQNDVAERKNRTVVEMARSMLKAKNLPNQFWAEVVATPIYLRNISPTKAVQNQTPYEAWYGVKPSVSHLKVFGCISYALIKYFRHKLEKKSEKCVFVGYSLKSKAYRLYNPISGKIVISREALFNETTSWSWRSDIEGQLVPLSEDSEVPGSSEGVVGTQPNSPPTSPTLSSTSATSSSLSSSSSSSSETPPKKFRSLKEIYETCDFTLSVSDPIWYSDAVKNQMWQSAMTEEIKSIEKNNTWQLVDLPQEKNAIGLKWVFRTKYHADGSVQKHKARLVAKGYAQEHGVDYDETFSPVAHFEIVRTFLALAAQLGWSVFQFDVKSAFLNGELKEEVFIEQPEGFVVFGQENKVYKLQKALYGLKQAPRAWYNKSDCYLIENGFERSENEPTLYFKKQGKSDFLVVCLYVDDMIYMGSCESIVTDFKSCMTRKFEMTDLGLLHYFLGLEVKQGADGILITQKKFVMDLVRKFHMSGVEPACTPKNINEKLSANDGSGLTNARHYRSMVGGLNYLSHTRPDIAFSVSVASRFMHNPTKHHLGAVKRILKYVAGTSDYGIWNGKVQDLRLVGYSDSDWAGSVDDRKSTSGYVFTLGSGVIA